MKLTTLSLFFILFISCENTSPSINDWTSKSDMEYVELKETPPTHQAPALKTNNQQRVSKKVLKTGEVYFQSENVLKDYGKIKVLLSTYDSYIAHENTTNSGYRISYGISIRVAASNYDSLLNKLSKLSAKVESKSSTIKDVTEQYYDLKTRIKNKKILEERYLALLKKANNIKDMLAIERSLNEIRNEIETAEGSFKLLSKQVSYSTIHLQFYEVLPNGYTAERFWSRILTAVSQGWKGFLHFLVSIISAWPFIIISIVGVYFFKRIRKRIKINK